MAKKFLYSYHMGSKSASALSKALRKATDNFVCVIRHEGSKFVPRKTHTVVNWGSQDKNIQQYAKTSRIINDVAAVKLCSDKRQFFRAIQGQASHPEFTTSLEEANRWAAEGPVVGRLNARDSGGRGLYMSDEAAPEDFASCCMFTKYIPKLSEFRVHIFRGKVLDVQQKKLRKTDREGREVDRDAVNWRIRSYNNGYVFAREDIVVPDSVIEEGLKAFGCIPGLDFGAFDVIYNKKRNQAYVLECNTAPGLEGTTLDNYVKEFAAV